MTFQELRALLRQLGRNPLVVTCAKYDTAEDLAQAPSDAWIVWEHDGQVDVGAAERGRFVLTHRFETEAAACDYLAEILGTPPPVHQESTSEKARSEAVTMNFEEQMRRQLAERAQQGRDPNPN